MAKKKEESVEQALKQFRNPKIRRTFDEALAEWNKIYEPEYEANRKSEILSAKDFAVTINARA